MSTTQQKNPSINPEKISSDVVLAPVSLLKFLWNYKFTITLLIIIAAIAFIWFVYGPLITTTLNDLSKTVSDLQKIIQQQKDIQNSLNSTTSSQTSTSTTGTTTATSTGT